MTDPRYPIGPFEFAGPLTADTRAGMIDAIRAAPAALRAAVNDLNDHQLDTPYRPGGWTVRQVVHHVPESHLNAYTRFKLALTEDNPTIKPYDEARWARLPDTGGPIEPSLTLLEALHRRWLMVLESLTAADYGRTFFHPESQIVFTLDRCLAQYAWHGRHHVAHVTSLRERERW